MTNRRSLSERNPVDIPPGVKSSLEQLFSAHPEIEKVFVFGSRARGDGDDRSDIDLAIVAPTATPRRWLEVVFALEEADTLLSIDVVRWKEASVALRERILAEGKVLYERSEGAAKPRQS